NGLGSRQAGIVLEDAPGNVVALNVVSANGDDGTNGYAGVYLVGSGATGNQLQGNMIGLDVTGAAALGNALWGMYISAPGNLIGGTTAGAGNVVSANGDAGIYLAGSGATRNQLQGNIIGADLTGTAARGNAR